MCLIAFYFLLRVGEYTYHRETDTRLTYQFTIRDVAFWHNNALLNQRDQPTTLQRYATAATLTIRNQKNGCKNVSIHVEATNDLGCPIRALIRRVAHIHTHTKTDSTALSTYFESAQSRGRQLHSHEITSAVRRAVHTLNLARNGLTPASVGSHSLRAGGAMAMYLNNVPHDTIRKLGRWKSDTFLLYIHEQISAFSKGVSTQMSKPIQFHNVRFQPR